MGNDSSHASVKPDIGPVRLRVYRVNLLVFYTAEMMTTPNTKTDALWEDLLRDCASPADILGEHGLLKGLTKRVVERALAAELPNHLGYAPSGSREHPGRECSSGHQ
jgi:hypothetical protein